MPHSADQSVCVSSMKDASAQGFFFADQRLDSSMCSAAESHLPCLTISRQLLPDEGMQCVSDSAAN